MRYALIVAGGNSERYGKDKLNEPLLGKTVLQHSVDVFSATADVVMVVGRKVDGTLYADGGATRFLSVLNGLNALPDEGVVAIHDGARPFVSRKFAETLYAEAEKYGSAIPRLPITDTLYLGDVTTEREKYFTVQAPQVFEIFALKTAYAEALKSKKNFTDDSSVFGALHAPHFVDGRRDNIKITFDGDLPDFRVGSGFDVHPFADGDGFPLGGVFIPFEKRLQAHSDGDVLCHAVCDGILSAIGEKDIGNLFPDTDAQYKDIDSTLLLDKCVFIAEKRGFEVVNMSAVVICQQPKIAPHIDKIASRLAKILKISPCCVGISATTTEHLGALGNGDGIAVQATVLLRRTNFSGAE